MTALRATRCVLWDLMMLGVLFAHAAVTASSTQQQPQDDEHVVRRLPSYDLTFDHVERNFADGEGHVWLIDVMFRHDYLEGSELIPVLMDPTSCTTEYPSGHAGLTAEAMEISAGLATGRVSVNLGVFDGLGPFWSQEGAVGTLRFCYRVKVVTPKDFVVTYSDVLVISKLSMMANFQATGPVLPVLLPGYIIEDYPILIFVCDDTAAEIVDPAPLEQGDSLQLCITHYGDALQSQPLMVDGIYWALITQQSSQAGVPDVTVTTIDQGIDQNSNTEHDCTSVPGICRFTTQLQKDFTCPVDTCALEITGLAKMTSTSRRRRAEGELPGEPDAGEDATTELAQFQYEVELQSAFSSSSSPPSFSFHSFASHWITTLLACVWIVVA